MNARIAAASWLAAALAFSSLTSGCTVRANSRWNPWYEAPLTSSQIDDADAARSEIEAARRDALSHPSHKEAIRFANALLEARRINLKGKLAKLEESIDTERIASDFLAVCKRASSEGGSKERAAVLEREAAVLHEAGASEAARATATESLRLAPSLAALHGAGLDASEKELLESTCRALRKETATNDARFELLDACELDGDLWWASEDDRAFFKEEKRARHEAYEAHRAFMAELDQRNRAEDCRHSCFDSSTRFGDGYMRPGVTCNEAHYQCLRKCQRDFSEPD